LLEIICVVFYLQCFASIACDNITIVSLLWGKQLVVNNHALFRLG